MSVVTRLRVPTDSLELGRIIDSRRILELKAMVPLGEQAVPLISVYNDDHASFADDVRTHTVIDNFRIVSRRDHETIYEVTMNVERDVFFNGVRASDAYLLNGIGTNDGWAFTLLFPDHDAVSSFQEYCLDTDIPIDVGRMYNPGRRDSGQLYGLTPEQRETLIMAVQAGYYSIPRQTSTAELAREFDISDQAVIERLRRAITALVEQTLITAVDDTEAFEPAR